MSCIRTSRSSPVRSSTAISSPNSARAQARPTAPVTPDRRVRSARKGDAEEDFLSVAETFDFAEAVSAIELHRARVAVARAETGAVRAHRADVRKPMVDHAFSHAAALQARQQVDMQMRGVFEIDPLRRSVRVMDVMRHALIPRP